MKPAKVVRLVAKPDGLNAEMREALALAQKMPANYQEMVITLIQSCADQLALLGSRKRTSNIGKPVIDMAGDDRPGA